MEQFQPTADKWKNEKRVQYLKCKISQKLAVKKSGEVVCRISPGELFESVSFLLNFQYRYKHQHSISVSDTNCRVGAERRLFRVGQDWEWLYLKLEGFK